MSFALIREAHFFFSVKLCDVSVNLRVIALRENTTETLRTLRNTKDF